MKINRFEEIEAWQKGRALTKLVYQCVESNKKFDKDFRFRSQITNASLSVTSNIAEGFSRQSNKEFIQFLFIAKGSIAEIQSQLYAASDLGYISKEDFTKIYDQADKTAKMVSGFITYLKSIQ